MRVAGGDGEMGEISTKTLKHQNPKTPKPNPQPLTPFFLFTFYLSREAQLFVGWVSGSVTHAGVGFHASTQPTFILYLIPPTHLF